MNQNATVTNQEVQFLLSFSKSLQFTQRNVYDDAEYGT